MNDLIFSSALLRDVDARGKEELLRAGRERAFADGELVYRAGEEGDAIVVCTEGAFSVSIAGRDDAQPRHVRDALLWDAFGEEAILPFAARQSSAKAKGDARAILFPAHLVRRALGRVGKEGHEARIRRAVERALAAEAICGSTLFSGASSREREVVLDAATVRDLARGEYLFREGEPAREIFLVASGSLSVVREDAGRPRVLAYVGVGDAIGDAELGGKRKTSVFAFGPARVVVIDGKVLDAKRRAPAVTRLTIAGGLLPTEHLLRDRHRFEVARSMLAIDADTCIRCGHCASACASVHADGASRLDRTGEKFWVPSLGVSLIAPTSCQHCQNPACMPPCPTGAIAREESGEVTIRAELCTGCGACAKACPWDNIAMCARGEAKAPPGLEKADLAVKCDLCSGRSQGPACVAACPVSAIARIEPSRVLVELGADPRATAESAEAAFERSRPVPLAVFAGVLALGALTTRAPLPRAPSGWAAATVLALCVGYMFWKRVAFRWAKKKGALSVHVHYVAHLAFGAFLPGFALAHAHVALRLDAGGLALVALLAAASTGALLTILHRAVPNVVSRGESKIASDAKLGEDLRRSTDALLGAVSNKSALVKTLFERVLGPYDRAWLGPSRFAFSGRSQREEREQVLARIDALLEGRGKDARGDLIEVTRIVVERRALRAKAFALRVLRGTAVAHVVVVAISIALVVMHAWEAMR